MYRLLNYICFILSLALFFGAPPKYDASFCNVCSVIFFISLLSFFKIKHKKNYFDFDTIFLFTAIFMFYLYPIVVYPVTKSTDILLFDFDVSKISKGTALSTVGLCSYMLGGIGYKRSFKKKKFHKKLLKYSPLIAISIFCFIVYILLGGWLKMKMAYQNDHSVNSGPSEYFYLLSYISLLTIIAIVYNNEYILFPRNFNFHYISKVQIGYLLIFIVMMLLAGGRTIPMQLILCSFGLYTYFYLPIRLWQVILLMSLGILLMFGVLLLRSQSSLMESGGNNDFVMFTDLLVVARNSYECVSFVEKNGISFGVSMLSPLLAAVPFLQGILLPLFNISQFDTSSAMALTAYSLGKDSRIGVGTNLVADLYIAYGILGVVLGMYVLGKFMASVFNRGKGNIYALASYTVMISYAVYLVRAEYFFFVRALFWSWIMIYMLKYKRDSRL